MENFWLIPLGFFVGAFGTLIGSGGGFILVPVLLWLYPNESPETITSISLAVVFFNALSGSIAYSQMGRIDYKSGSLLAMATIPGSILGTMTTCLIPRQIFNGIFGVFLVLISIYLLLNPSNKENRNLTHRVMGYFSRTVVEKDGTVHKYSYNLLLGIFISIIVGYLTSLLGIGGGIIHVPVLINLLNFPVHLATATSHFILSIMSFSGTIVHVVTGSFTHGFKIVVFLSTGVLIGAPLGAKLSKYVKGNWIIRTLAVALGFVGIRLFIMAL